MWVVGHNESPLNHAHIYAQRDSLDPMPLSSVLVCALRVTSESEREEGWLAATDIFPMFWRIGKLLVAALLMKERERKRERKRERER
jgi:hypothetical protein